MEKLQSKVYLFARAKTASAIEGPPLEVRGSQEKEVIHVDEFRLRSAMEPLAWPGQDGQEVRNSFHVRLRQRAVSPLLIEHCTP